MRPYATLESKYCLLRVSEVLVDQQEVLHKLQAEELDVLLAIAELCERNDITWFLISGTALGAARHQGFIPWDDDIDIGMLREDYDRFLELAPDGLPTGYSLHTAENTKGFAALFAKVYRDRTVFQTAETREAGCDQGIFVDIFPFDRAPADERACSRLRKRAAFWQRASYLYHSGYITVPHKGIRGAMERIACRLAHVVTRFLLTPNYILRRFRLLSDGTPASSTQEADRYLMLSYPYRDPVAKELLVPTGMAAFEGHELSVPARLHEYLEGCYGDWRKMPAPEDRHTHLPERLVFSDGTEWVA